MRISLYPFLILAVAGCSTIPLEAHYNRGAPESLLDLSTETVSVSLASLDALEELTRWVNQDQPSRAELYCMDSSPMCREAENVFTQFSVPVETKPSAANEAVLVYERVMARDCENRFIDNSINPYNLNHPTFGCSTAANMVQMVGDKRQFIAPNLLEFHDGEKLQQVYRNYANPSKAAGNKKSESLLRSVVIQ